MPTPPTWRLGETPWLDDVPGLPGPGVRVIIDNDFSGDPDDLYQVVHHVLSPAVEVRAIIASHLAEGEPNQPTPFTAANARRRLEELFAVVGLDASDRIFQGSDHGLVDRTTPQDTSAARAIVEEAMRDDPRPLFVACGGGLTEIASAYLLEPAIAERLTVVWIGGGEYPGLADPPPGAHGAEYNLNIDVTAGQVVFEDSTLALWQVPRDVYRQCLVSDIELRERVRSRGALGRFLYDALTEVATMVASYGGLRAETYPLGDQPLVLLTALQSFWQPDTSSSKHVTLPAPRIGPDGSPVPTEDGRAIRVYTQVDTRLMFEDMFLKLDVFTRWQRRNETP